MFTQNIFPRNFIRNAVGLQNCLSAENQDFIKIKYSIASVVENDTPESRPWSSISKFENDFVRNSECARSDSWVGSMGHWILHQIGAKGLQSL